jgi:hypothetical protein
MYRQRNDNALALVIIHLTDVVSSSICSGANMLIVCNRSLSFSSHLYFGLVLGLSVICVRASAEEKPPAAPDKVVIEQTTAAMQKAVARFVEKASTRGGYVYQVSIDGKQRFGEGAATPTEIWVQPPGTPSVGLALLRAHQATGDAKMLGYADQAAEAIMFGQLESGGWADRIDFDPKGKRADHYRHGKGNAKGRNYSTLDDNKTQAALRFLIEMDKHYAGKNAAIHEAVVYALDNLLLAQFPSGAFPQGWNKPVESYPVVKASFPDYDWRTEGRIKEYWDYPTLNDGLAGTVSATLWLAYETYKDEPYKDALLKLGDFLILAQLPEPQPAWAQQYNHSLIPMWARKFEPPAVVGTESEDVLQTLLFITEKTGQRRFLKPIPAAIAWLKRSRLPDGQIARFYELKTNKPLYMVRDAYTLTYDDSDLPTHYGFKTDPKTDKIEARYEKVFAQTPLRESVSSLRTLQKDALKIIAELDDYGQWVTEKQGVQFLDSAVFSKNLSRLSAYLTAAKQ